MTDPVKPLSDDELIRLESRSQDTSLDYAEVDEVLRRVPALCETVRALREDLKYRYEVIEELRRCRDRWLTMLNPPTGYESVDDAIRLLQDQLAQVTQERDNARDTLKQKSRELISLKGRCHQ